MNRTTGASSTLDQYLREINRVALLTVEEERRLAREFRDQGNKRAGHRLVEANLRFVVKVAFEYRSYGLRMADLIQEGNIGLMKAVQKFDPDKEIRLISYAVWWIRAYIQNHILKSWSLVKIGTTQAQRKLFFSLARTRHEIERAHPGRGPRRGGDRRQPRREEAPRPAERRRSRCSSGWRGATSPSTRRSPTARSTHLEFTAVRRRAAGRGARAARRRTRSLARRVAEAMGRLDPRERHIVEARIMGDGKETLRDLGQHFGFSRERARQLEIRALEKLRRELQPLADEIGWPVAASRSRGGRVRAAPAARRADRRRGRVAPRRRLPARSPGLPPVTANGENACCTGISSIAFTFTWAGSETIQRIASATSAPPSGFTPSYTFAALPASPPNRTTENSVSAMPGSTQVARTAVPSRSERRLSVNWRTNALVAP